ncbi:MAG: hypothetical protein U0T82_05480 [Bacteroidales bacterium]
MHRFENLPDHQKAMLMGIEALLLGAILLLLYYTDLGFFHRTSRLIGGAILAFLGLVLLLVAIMLRKSR